LPEQDHYALEVHPEVRLGARNPFSFKIGADPLLRTAKPFRASPKYHTPRPVSRSISAAMFVPAAVQARAVVT